MRYGNPSKKTRVIASLLGHAIEFPGRGTVAKATAPKEFLVDDAGTVYVPVPPRMAAEVASKGMVPESEIEEVDTHKGPVKPQDAEELKKAVYVAFDMLVEMAERESFAGTGVPKPAAVEKLLGYAITNGEVKDLWGKYVLDKKDGS